MKILFVLVILISVSLINNKQITASQVELAIDCGSFVEYKTQNGIVYKKDQYFSDSKVADYSLNSEKNGVDIRFTQDQGIYFTERHQDFNFHYNLPVAREGKYVIILKFTELYFEKRGKRQFNVNIGQKTVKGNLDIVAEVQQNSAYDLYLPIEIKGNEVYANNALCPNGYDKYRKTIMVEFEKIEGRDNPKVDGIMIVRGGLGDSDYYEIDKMRREWTQEMERVQTQKEEQRVKEEQARLRKKEKIMARHDMNDEEEEETDDDDQWEREWWTVYVEMETLLPAFFLIIVFVITVVNLRDISSSHQANIDRKKKKKRI